MCPKHKAVKSGYVISLFEICNPQEAKVLGTFQLTIQNFHCTCHIFLKSFIYKAKIDFTCMGY